MDETAEQMQADHDLEVANAERVAADKTAAEQARIDREAINREALARESIVEQKPLSFGADPAPVDIPVDTAKTRLRAFEDATFGRDAPRIAGEVERGVGSPFARMNPVQKAHHAALEQMVIAEQRHADAVAALESAKVAHDLAVKRAQAAEQVVAEHHDDPQPNEPDIRLPHQINQPRTDLKPGPEVRPLPFGADNHEVV